MQAVPSNPHYTHNVVNPGSDLAFSELQGTVRDTR